MLGACDRASAPAPPPLMATVANAPVPTALALTPLATLPAGRVTLLAPMPDGTIFAAQADGDVVAIRPGATKPQATPLTTAAVLESLGLRDGRGQFAALAAREDGRLAFCFIGAAAGKPFAAIGTFEQAAGQIFLPVDQIILSAVDSDLATDAARPSLFTAGDDAWLWRATDREIRLLTISKLRDLQPQLRATRISLEQVKDVVERSTWEWSPTPTRGSFLLTDTASRWIRRIDANGTLSHVARFDETVATITAAALDAAGRIVVLNCDRDGVVQGALVQEENVFKAILRDRFTGVEAAPLRVDRLHPLPGQANAFAVYDGTSGMVLRVQLR